MDIVVDRPNHAIAQNDVFHVRAMMQTSLKDSKTMKEVRDGSLKVLRIASHESSDFRLGYVSGIISSLGKDRIQEMESRLDKFTTFVRGMWELDSYNFPIFSSTDIFTKPLLSKLGKLTQDDFNSYWKSLLESGHVTDIFMTPNWQISNGATAEYNIAKEKNLVIHYWDINPKDCVILFVAPEDAKRHIYYTSDKPPHYMIHPSAMARDMRFLKTVGEMEFKEVKAMVDRHIRHSRRLAGEKSRNLEDSNRKWEEYYRGQDEYEVVIAQLRKDQASQNTK